MRLVTYQSDRGPRAGLLRGDTVVDVWDALGGADVPSVRAVLASGRVEEAARIGDGDGHALADVTLLPPVGDPDKIMCIGLNYAKHAAETNSEPPEVPSFFPKYRNSLAPPGASVPLPRFSEQVDYEAEVAFVIGRRCKDVAEGDALSVIGGYALLNDLSARDYQKMTSQWGAGKAFDGGAPFGPALVTPDEVGPPDAIDIGLELNGETMQSSNTSDLIHSVPAIVAFLSKIMTLEPGDIVSTGTPEGVGMGRDPKVWLRPGDRTVVISSVLGRLETTHT